jgi:hypothetical protein
MTVHNKSLAEAGNVRRGNHPGAPRHPSPEGNFMYWKPPAGVVYCRKGQSVTSANGRA